MSYDRCRKCGTWGSTRTHKCPPRWHAWWEDCGYSRDDSIVVYGVDAEDAATAWATWYDANTTGYPIASGRETPTVFVVREDDDTDAITEVVVSGETVPQYSAREIP